jgi:hypothetical protein
LRDNLLIRAVRLASQEILRGRVPAHAERAIPSHRGPERPRVEERGQQVEADRRIAHAISVPTIVFGVPN